MLHELKFNTFKTYRKHDKTKIIMTNLSTKTQFYTSSNNIDDSFDAEFLQQNELTEINNFDKLLNDAVEILDLARSNNISIDESAYFFIGNRSKKPDIELFLGDFDFISKYYTSSVKLELLTSIKGFIIYFMEKSSQQKYLSILENKFKNL
jgi:hypothetical protein